MRIIRKYVYAGKANQRIAHYRGVTAPIDECRPQVRTSVLCILDVFVEQASDGSSSCE